MLFLRRTVDIRSKRLGPAGRLSNFTKRSFVFDGVECRSIEGVLQGFKFSSPTEQAIVCGLWGIQAKLAGEKASWKESQTLYWNETAYKRDSEEYQHLLNRLYSAVFEQDEAFRKDIKAVKNRRLIHSIGSSQQNNTVLTEEEFIKNLKMLCDKV
ncbi:MAG: hypothetical protein IKM06_04885 [Clostridia bacterium]|nr:hypothetical protein [Clostridia bacterium]